MLSFTFLRDAENADWNTNPEAYVIEKKTITNKTKLKIPLAKNGGCAMRIIDVIR